MTTNNEFETRRAELALLIDTWGGAPARWPPSVRARIAALSTTVPVARELLAEATALDRLLDAASAAPAPVAPAQASALTDRIMAAAMAQPQPALALASAEKSDGNIVAFRPKPQPRPVTISSWPTAGLIAASLMAGIYLGGSLNLTPMLQELAEAAGLSTVIDPAIAAIGDDLNDEETL
jgi:hypothetical protein